MSARPFKTLLPLKTVNPLNGQHGHWRKTAARRKSERSTAFVMVPVFKLPATVTLTRLSAGTLDDDAVPGAMKSIRDGICDKVGIPDNDPRIRFVYAQERCNRGAFGVRVEIEHGRP